MRKSSSNAAPVLGCLVGGLGIPLLWLWIADLSGSGASPGTLGLPSIGILLAPIGILCGVLFKMWKGRNAALSGAELVAELKSMSEPSLLEYKHLCPPGSQEFALAEAELSERQRQHSP